MDPKDIADFITDDPDVFNENWQMRPELKKLMRRYAKAIKLGEMSPGQAASTLAQKQSLDAAFAFLGFLQREKLIGFKQAVQIRSLLNRQIDYDPFVHDEYRFKPANARITKDDGTVDSGETKALPGQSDYSSSVS